MRKITVLITAILTAAVCAGCGNSNKAPNEWYKESIAYYQDEYGSNSSDKYGYLLKDLDGDGVDELLIGLINDAPQTQFMDVIIWHSDLGATHVMGGTKEHSIYLISDGTLISDSLLGGGMDAMKFSSQDNAFSDVGTGHLIAAGKYELTPLQ